MRVVGTAGHIDHGKSSLVHALTGIHPDRLQQEQQREMTIELGFAWLTLPHGETISLVDVPGHEAFIKNMLAGAGGMDAALLVIAADEGIMPQTREHLAILDLLKIQGGVVALTKTDMTLDPGWLDLVQQEIRAALAPTVLRDAEIIPVSAKTKRGLPELSAALERVLAHVSTKRDRARPRLPIDRVFTMSGFGTVVTGTLSDGSLQVGDEVEIAPRDLRSRIRGLQSHKQKLEIAPPGGRVAVNLTNIATTDLARGDVLIRAGTYTSTTMLDAKIEWLSSAPRPLAHSQELALFLYASQMAARVRLLDQDTLAPGQRGWAQLILESPIIAAAGDRFILRYPSPGMTVGGGVIVEPHPGARHKRNRPEVIARLERALQGTPADLVVQYIETHPASTLDEIARGTALDSAQTTQLLSETASSGQLVPLGAGAAPLYISRTTWNHWRDKMVRELTGYHKQFPLRAGMPVQEFKSRMGIAARVHDLALALGQSENTIHFNDKSVALATHRVTFDTPTQQKINTLLEQFSRAPYNPPSYADAENAVGIEPLNALVEQGQLERVAPNVLFTPHTVETMQAWVIETLRAQDEITAAQLRDRFETSRKYAIAFLEYLDAKHITQRQGDKRTLVVSH